MNSVTVLTVLCTMNSVCYRVNRAVYNELCLLLF